MKVHFYATLRRTVGCKCVDIPLGDGATVDDVVARVLERFPALRPELLDADGALSRHVHVFINGRGTPWLERQTRTVIRDGDRVELFPAVAGG